MADESNLITDKSNLPKVMISSTALDLPEHRKEVMDACLRQGMFPLMMDHLPANDDNAVSVSFKMVNQANFYLGVFAHRYGYIPEANNPHQISITEMEYDRAAERGIPRMVFVMDKTHPITIDDVEQGEGGIKLKSFVDRVRVENVVNFFKSPADLRAYVIDSLSELRVPNVKKFHHVNPIPEPPEAYIAHPYTLLQTHGLVGRQEELNLLTNWVTKLESDIYKAHILNIVAIGGVGKSALTWKWFNEIAPEEMKPLAGRIWWSFYESDATFENFIIRALAYVSRRSIKKIKEISLYDREIELLAILDKTPYLVVLDGLERVLIAYARMDAAYLSDSDYDEQMANYVVGAYGLPPSKAHSIIGGFRLRKTSDPRAGSFLRKLANVRESKILVSTRLYPFDLQMGNGTPLPRCNAIFLPGLSNDDAVNLWRQFGISGSSDLLIPIFNTFGNHALLIQALASEIANYRPAPASFERWREDHPQFDPAKSENLYEAMGHVLEYALRGLNHKARQVLQTIAAFRMPAQYDTLASLRVGRRPDQCENEYELDKVLTELEDRGLVGWDKLGNRYDLHPIVRGVVWNNLGDGTKRYVYRGLNAHFKGLPGIAKWREVNSLEDLSPTIELYSTLIGLGYFDDAVILFSGSLHKAMVWRLSASRQSVELLEMLFPDGMDQIPRLNHIGHRYYVLTTLALSYKLCGQPKRAIKLFRRAIALYHHGSGSRNVCVTLTNLSNTLRLTGELQEAERFVRHALRFSHASKNRFNEGVSLNSLGLIYALRGVSQKSEIALKRARSIDFAQNNSSGKCMDEFYLAQRAVWFGHLEKARAHANLAWKLAGIDKNEADYVRASRVQGEAELNLDNPRIAEERLNVALTRARTVNQIEEELPTLSALAELRRQQGDEKAAREFLDDVWEFAERGRTPLFHADALNVLAQIERDAGNRDKAVEAATKAYELAWCDGPPYAYHWGLEKAKKHLNELKAPFPEMPEFDESKYEPMPEVEIDPDDEFHVGSS